MITWIVGQGGLLGQALARQCPTLHEAGPVPWEDAPAAARTLYAQAKTFQARTLDQPWRIIWAAGSATPATSRHEAFQELTSLEGLLNGIKDATPRGPGNFFLTSSAGGVFAGSIDPPFSIQTSVAPLSPYGELKIAQENLATDLISGSTSVIVGRVSNLYGPGQNLKKLQGLISRLSLSAITNQPLEIFVPLGTIRDYLFSDDAAHAILSLTHDVTRGPGVHKVILATGRGTTISHLIRTTRDVAKRGAPIAVGSHPSGRVQAVDLRLNPTFPLEQVTTLPAGIKSVYLDLLSRLQQAPLPK